MTTLRLGGPARRIVRAHEERELVEVVRDADRQGEPVLLLAGGSNVVIADEGFPGTVVHVATRGLAIREQDGRALVEVQAGEPWDALVATCVRDGLAGIECLSGIPGSAGATPIQNVGAYGQEVAQTLVSVRAYDRHADAVDELPAHACGFGYRTSAFKRTPGRWVVLSATFALQRRASAPAIAYTELARALGVDPGEGAPLTAVRDAVLALRRAKGMVVDPSDPESVSAGSFFTNPVLPASAFDDLRARVTERLGPDASPPAWPQPDGSVKTSAAWLVERAGFGRGYGREDGIAISRKHALALVNRGSGTAAELLALAREIAAGVRAAFGVELTPEPVFVGLQWP